MSRANPYEKHLGDQEPLKVLSGTARKIEQILEDLGSERMNQPSAPGKWSAREIVCHLADAEIAFAFRLRQTLAENHHIIQLWDQELWAVNYAEYEAREALTTFCAVRKWNLALVRSISPEAHAKAASHPERGPVSFKIIIETMGSHDINHLRQLDAIVKHFAPAHQAETVRRIFCRDSSSVILTD